MDSVTLTIIGGGAMGRGLARVLAQTGTPVRLYEKSAELRAELATELAGVTLHAHLEAAVNDADIVFLAVNVDQLRSAAEEYGPFARGDHIVLTACRGVGPGFLLPHDLIRAQTCVRKIGIIGGPIHARELSSGRQINALLASRYGEVVQAARAVIRRAPVTIHATRDVVGLQVAQAIGNVASIAAGMAEALDQSPTARGLLLAHGLSDARTLGSVMGADEHTFFGLAGITELLPRQVPAMDRHLELGRRIASGASTERALADMGSSVEGVATAHEAVALAARRSIELPLVTAVHDALAGDRAPSEALEAVLHRSLELA